MNIRSKYIFWKIIRQDWENGLSGDLAAKLRERLRKQRISGKYDELVKFVNTYKAEVQIWHDDFINQFGHGHFELLTAFSIEPYKKKSGKILTPLLVILLLVILGSVSLFGHNLFTRNKNLEISNLQVVKAVKEPIFTSEKDYFENEELGYQLEYPKGWKTEMLGDEIFFSPEAGGGRLRISFINEILEVNYDIENYELEDDFKRVGQEMKNSLVLIEPAKLDPKGIKSRYLETLANKN